MTEARAISDGVDLKALIERVRRCTEADNALDIAIDIALFRPDEHHVSVRANDAGTKLVYRRHDGRTDTHWAQDHTMDRIGRDMAIALLTSISEDTTHAK